MDEEQARELIAKRTTVEVASHAARDNVIQTMAVRCGRLKGDFQLIIKMACDVWIQQRFVLGRSQADKGFRERYRNPIIDERPNPFDVIASVPTKVVRNVE
ncbi:hypothetical protein [Bradyrhizobium sp. USDA 3458]|uniref:hypothetical protein n=1 Tax=Bradyrhizobium sp. USDA 3458 TaxID=2591461 RepID=UPI0011415DF5|nr:hypothetical protein [Bradyrhizobium sp. USDA 3458]